MNVSVSINQQVGRVFINIPDRAGVGIYQDIELSLLDTVQLANALSKALEKL